MDRATEAPGAGRPGERGRGVRRGWWPSVLVGRGGPGRGTVVVMAAEAEGAPGRRPARTARRRGEGPVELRGPEWGRRPGEGLPEGQAPPPPPADAPPASGRCRTRPSGAGSCVGPWGDRAHWGEALAPVGGGGGGIPGFPTPVLLPGEAGCRCDPDRGGGGRAPRDRENVRLAWEGGRVLSEAPRSGPGALDRGLRGRLRRGVGTRSREGVYRTYL